MPITVYTIYKIGLVATVNVFAATQEVALALGKTAIKNDGGAATWSIEKEIIQVVTP